MAEFSKYRKNCWKAEALENVADRIKYAMESEEDSKGYYIKRIEEQNEKPEEERDSWLITNSEEEIGKYDERIKIWQSLLKVVDKELMF